MKFVTAFFYELNVCILCVMFAIMWEHFFEDFCYHFNSKFAMFWSTERDDKQICDFISDLDSNTWNIDIQLPSPGAANDNHHEQIVELEEDISQSVDQNVVAHSSEIQLNQIVHSSHHELNPFNNGGVQTVLLSTDYPNSHYSPPPPYDMYQALHPCVQPTQYHQQIFQFPQQHNVQYLHQQRLQYPQHESLQYHEEMSYYHQQQQLPYPYQRDGNILSEPPIQRNICENCLIGVWCCFCVVPIFLLICIMLLTSYYNNF